jgi:hypothetical protein
MIPGTSCLATIVLSLRDKIHLTAEALLKLALMLHTPSPIVIVIVLDFRFGATTASRFARSTTVCSMSKVGSLFHGSR